MSAPAVPEAAPTSAPTAASWAIPAGASSSASVSSSGLTTPIAAPPREQDGSRKRQKNSHGSDWESDGDDDGGPPQMVFKKQDEPPPRDCPCGAGQCKQMITKKLGPNTGRRFHRCPNVFTGDDCDFFEWAEDPIGGGGSAGGGGGGDGERGAGGRGAKSTCFRCGAAGHWIRDCPKPREAGDGGQGSASGSASGSISGSISGSKRALDVDLEASEARTLTAPSQPEGGAASYMVIAEVEEDAAFGQLMATCKASIGDQYVQEKCFQRDGTRHLTLHTLNNLTAKQAARVRIDEPQPMLPFHLPMWRIKPWLNTPCIALGLSPSTTTDFCGALGGLSGLEGLPEECPPPKVDRPDNLHVSLYRRHGVDYAAAKPAFDRVHSAIYGQPLGSLKVVRLSIKRKGDDYANSRTLAEAN